MLHRDSSGYTCLDMVGHFITKTFQAGREGYRFFRRNTYMCNQLLGSSNAGCKKRLVLDRDVDVWIDLALKLPNVRIVPLSPKIAVRSTRLDQGFTGDPPDCMLIATALEYGLPVVSKDERIKKYTALKVVW